MRAARGEDRVADPEGETDPEGTEEQAHQQARDHLRRDDAPPWGVTTKVVNRLLHLGEHMAGYEHRLAVGGEAAHERAEPANAFRVEPVRGLVQDQQLRVAEQRAGEPEPLPHPKRVAANAT